MRICGIDPGAQGAMCVLDSNDPAYIQIFDLHKRSFYDMANWLYNQQIDRVVIEDVHSMYQVAAKSNFNFGKAVGVVHAIANIVTRGDDPLMVAPKVWQKAVGVNAKGSKFIKPQVAEIAKRAYPSIDLHTPRGRLKDGRSDAVMIAHYALYIHKGL
ncbi:MAG: hypothetical protein U9O94_06330 [Nanoarchaeota archaeon]|nr:hypothetical protein [Nanoarchaeota archaeon]